MDPDTSGDPRLGARIVALRRGAGARVHSLVHLARKRGRPRVPSATPRAAVEVPEVASVPARPLVAPASAVRVPRAERRWSAVAGGVRSRFKHFHKLKVQTQLCREPRCAPGVA